MNRSPLDVSIVLPTYNESESLPVIIPKIVDVLTRANIKGEVIVVDDNSPDGTADVGNRLAEQYPVRVHKRLTERGLATAVIKGFDMSEASVCVVMDADGSHPVSVLPQMVSLILNDEADIVVGSRHVEGGGSDNWPLFARFKSKFAAAFARGVTRMTDPTTGFMAVRRELLPNMDLDPIGWKIVLEVVVKAGPVRLKEVPIIFSDREYGQSKQSLSVLGEYLKHCYKLYRFRYPSLIEFIKFCIVGFSGLFVDLGVVSALKFSFGLDTRLCAIGGFSVAVSTNYLFNRFWTFQSLRNAPWLVSYLKFVAASLLGLGVRVLTIHALILFADIDRGYGYLITNFFGIVAATFVNFVGAKFFAFRPEKVAFGSKHDP
jgi:dolichol-phosphate mannosyltransferase